MKLCDYGCGQEAKYQFKNGKLCCSQSYRSCPEIKKSLKKDGNPFYKKKHTSKTKEKLQQYRLGLKHSDETKRKIKESMIGNKNPNYGKNWHDSEETKRKKSKANKGNIPWNKGKTFDELFDKEKAALLKENHRKKLKGQKPWNKNKPHTKVAILKMSINSKLTIDEIKTKYPFFSKIEEMRYNPDKLEEKEIQVHCKNNNCPNSKEKGGWFTSTFSQIQARKNQIEKQDGNDGSYFYCSEQCKKECILYNFRSNPFVSNNLPYTQEEYNIWRKIVLEQDNYECQRCNSKEKLHCHHIIPVKIEPMFALDPDNGIVLCEKCHYKYGHKDECSTGNLANKVCKSEGK